MADFDTSYNSKDWQIVGRIIQVLTYHKCDAIVPILASWGDTMDSDEVLRFIDDYINSLPQHQ